MALSYRAAADYPITQEFLVIRRSYTPIRLPEYLSDVIAGQYPVSPIKVNVAES
jgi:hypothetical protein